MVRFKKIRPRRASLAVSIIVGSPIATSNRSAALAYRNGSPRHDSRYSAIDISVWLRASNDRAKALNRESLYMIPLHNLVAVRLRRGLAYRRGIAHITNQPQHIGRLDTLGASRRNADRGQRLSHKQAIAESLCDPRHCCQNEIPFCRAVAE